MSDDDQVSGRRPAAGLPDDQVSGRRPAAGPPDDQVSGRRPAAGPPDDRYSRQRRLPEVGDAGQARIAAAAASVRGRDGAIIETEYLYRAGVERLSISPNLEPERFVHERHFRFFASRRVGAGAWRALSKIRRVLAAENG